MATNKHSRIHTHLHNAVPLVVGLAQACPNYISVNTIQAGQQPMIHTIRSVHKTPVFRQVNYFLINDNKLNSFELSQAC